MKWKEFLRDYFVFTRKERIGLLAVILIIVGIWIFPKVSAPGSPKTVSPDTTWITAAKKLMIRSGEPDSGRKADENNENEPAFDRRATGYSNETGQLFNFDPNVLSFEGWKKLGVREKTIDIIQKYLHKGGHFYKPEDLKRVYGFRTEEYARLQPYIRIPSPNPLKRESDEKPAGKKETPANGTKYTIVDINTADTSAFIALPGIGNKLATRIVSFREKLGGFYSIDQIAETYGLVDSSFRKIKPFLKLENRDIKKLNVNTASKDEMKSHPYIKLNLANAIVEYRNQHGDFSSLEDLKKITLITTEVFDKIKFYLVL